MKKVLSLVLIFTVVLSVFVFPSFAENKFETINIGDSLTRVFSADGDFDEHYYTFKPTKTDYYSFTVTAPNTANKEALNQTDLSVRDSNDNELEWDYWSDIRNNISITVKLSANKNYFFDLVCWGDGPVSLTSTLLKHTHSFKTTDLIHSSIYWDGEIFQECKVCGFERSVIIPQINEKSIKLSATAFYYNGTVKTPTVIVKDVKGNVLKQKTDYFVSYSKGRTNVGTYKVKITFNYDKGKYSGDYLLSFKIIPNGTSISKVAAGKKLFVVQWKKQATQTTGYQLQYSTNAKFTGAKTVTIKSPKILKSTVKNLSAKKVYFVRIRTYKTVSKVNYFSGWSKAVKVKTK